MSPQLRQPEAAPLLARLGKLEGRVRALRGDLTPPDFARQPAAGAWSIGNVLEHLLLADGSYLHAIRDAGARARAQGRFSTGAAWRPSLFGGLLERSLRPESKRRLPAPKIYRPGPAARPDALAAFLAQQAALADRLREDADLDWNGVRLSSPVNRLLRINLGDAFHILVTHTDRHLGQIARARAALGLAPAKY